ncbi:MAG: acetate--CoA ligase, partial [Alphaproteobacteria bacterium]|nr:acetate--CoA ligase [Alphaproteobacteria bacterium]
MHYSFQIQNQAEYEAIYAKSIADPASFWEDIANQFLWKQKWQSVLEWNFIEPKVTWFQGATLNITENCLDRHLATHPNKPAIIFEPNNINEPSTTLTYQTLYEKVCLWANVLKHHGVKKGDRVCIYMGMTPELSIAVLACARIGAIHSVIFGGFSAQSIADRLEDSHAGYIITADGAFRGSKEIPLKTVVDEALIGIDSVKKVFIYNRTHTPVSMIKGRDFWWHDEIKIIQDLGLKDCPAEEMAAEDPLFILYTSGSTGKPKGVVHACGGYMVYATYTFVNVFHYQPHQVFFCTADIGWITGHTYIVYGPLCAGGTSMIFEGIPTYPTPSRFWQIIDKHQVNIFYTAPTAIRSLMNFGLEPLQDYDLKSLQVLGTVGEPINEEAWHWYNEHIGKKNCPVIDTWWQTETGATLISNLAFVTEGKPGWATYPLPGILPIIVDAQGIEAEIDADGNQKGNLCLKLPWPSIIRTTYNNHERCRINYFDTFKNLYFTGDGAIKNKLGQFRITGRVDDVLNISGHRLGTAEIENALNMHTGVIESAVVGYPHAIKGQGIYAFIIYNGLIDYNNLEEIEYLKQDIFQTVTKIIGA